MSIELEARMSIELETCMSIELEVCMSIELEARMSIELEACKCIEMKAQICWYAHIFIESEVCLCLQRRKCVCRDVGLIIHTYRQIATHLHYPHHTDTGCKEYPQVFLCMAERAGSSRPCLLCTVHQRADTKH